VGRLALGLAIALGLGLARPGAAAEGGAVPAPAPPPPPGTIQIDTAGWTPAASEGARLEVAPDPGPDGPSLRLDFDLRGGGWVIARKAVSLDLPRNWVLSFRVRGHAPPEQLQVKLVDRSGRNVWWWRHRADVFAPDWKREVVFAPRFTFAWGPAGGGLPRHIGHLEIALAATTPASGTLWIDQLRIEPRERLDRQPRRPDVSASSSAPGHPPKDVLDFDPTSSWHDAASDPDPWLLLDYGRLRQYGGLVIDWDPRDYATAYEVETSDDGKTWTTVYQAKAGQGGRDWIYLPDHESRMLRIVLQRSSRGQGYGIVFAGVAPLELADSPNRFMEQIAHEEPRGWFPRYLLKEQTYWSLVGADDDDKEALLSVDGALEVDREAFSIEPFLWVDGRLFTWADVATTPSLADGSLPIPSVAWSAGDVTLRITAFAAGPAGASTLVARYRVQNEGRVHHHVRLFLAIRPFQVSPPWQNLNMVGGVAPIRRLVWEDGAARVGEHRVVYPLSPPDGFGAARSEQGPVTRYLVAGRLPPGQAVADPVGFVSGAFVWQMGLDPGDRDEASVAVPFHEETPKPPVFTDRGGAQSWVADQLEETQDAWRKRLGRFTIDLPPSASALSDSVRASVAWILVNRDGPRIQPGSRCYARSWIRDGALTSGALLELGYDQEAEEFLRWYASYQYDSGRIPCCVDARGPDPTPENDSEGEFIWAVMEVWRHTQDTAFLEELWPHVVRAAEAIDALRRQRLGAAWQTPDKLAYYGLVPESISHEGYAGHPVHSYWDDAFALRGLTDAAAAAVVLGDREQAARFSAMRDEFRHDLLASIDRVMAGRQLDYIPASVELADFDPNSTAIFFDPVGLATALPAGPLAQTYERFWHEFEERQLDQVPWTAFTPYEVRDAVPLLRLGHKDRALKLLEDLVAGGQRPPAWHGWPEIVWRDASAPRFLGDLPHGWVASSYLRAVRRLFVDERPADGVLVLAAGVPEAWVDEAPGVSVSGLSTYYGPLAYRMRADGPDRVDVTIERGLAVLPGGLVIESPRSRPLVGATVNGRDVQEFDARSATVHEVPAHVVLRYAPAAD
jgi:hypothetical protein